MSIETDEAALKRLNQETATKESKRDDAAKKWFGELLAEHILFRRADTTVVDKASFLKGLDNPDLFIARDAEDIQLTVMGDRALVVLIIRTKRQDGGESRFRNIRLFSRSGESWVMEFWYNYEITSL